LDAPLNWSSQAESLKQLLIAERKKKKYRTAPQIYTFLLTLDMHQRGIAELDQALLQFDALTDLNVSDNKLTRLNNIPHTVTMLQAYGNRYACVTSAGLFCTAMSTVYILVCESLSPLVVTLVSNAP
jgi:hypothetical protein